jgi:crossover junction endodeoxyribonuclease RuvC
MIVLGIDPGTTRIGIGVVKKDGSLITYKKSCILPIKEVCITEGDRLFAIEKEIKKILKENRPDVVGIESIYFSKNKKTAISVSQARGVILKTIAEHSIPYKEFSPSEIKLAITGSGSATKNIVSKMVGVALNVPTKKVLDDETDALAIAIALCYIKKYDF